MGRQKNDEVEVNIEVNYIAVFDDSIITNENYPPPLPLPTKQVF